MFKYVFSKKKRKEKQICYLSFHYLFSFFFLIRYSLIDHYYRSSLNGRTKTDGNKQKRERERRKKDGSLFTRRPRRMCTPSVNPAINARKSINDVTNGRTSEHREGKSVVCKRPREWDLHLLHMVSRVASQPVEDPSQTRGGSQWMKNGDLFSFFSILSPSFSLHIWRFLARKPVG